MPTGSLAFPPSDEACAHFVGIGGVGMAGLAWLFHELGWNVSGCDAGASEYSAVLSDRGIPVSIGHSVSHVTEFNPEYDIIVRTAAVSDSQPEISFARRRGIKVVSRGCALAELSGMFPTIAVCGAHGKTTTACLIASALGQMLPVSWCVGGKTKRLGFVAGGILSPNGFLVVEADESDGSLAEYTPRITVITNVDTDHVDRFKTPRELDNVFKRVIEKTSDAVIYNCSDQRTAKIVKSARLIQGCRVVPVKIASNGHSPPMADDEFVASNPKTENLSISFDTYSGGEFAGSVKALMPGIHNVSNCLLALAACRMATGRPVRDCLSALNNTAEMPDRRFERIPTESGAFSLFRDYAHHPNEISAFVSAASGITAARRIAVFQPHRYSRTKVFADKFPAAFSGMDHIIILPVFTASEQPVPGGSSADLYAAFRKAGMKNPDLPKPVYIKSASKLLPYLSTFIRSGDAVFLIGAGDIADLAQGISEISPNCASCKILRLGAYGTAATVKCVTSDLQEFLHSPFPRAIIAGGTNTMISASGFPGTIFRPGREYSYIRGDGAELTVGCAASGAALLSYCVDHGLSGLEFMAGIPGQCGGWLATNAGTQGRAFCDVVTSVRAIELSTGREITLTPETLRAGYRTCPGMRGKFALEIRLKLCGSTPEAVSAAMRDAKSRRFDFSGLKTAGSVFKNPDGKPAGRILEAAGCKGMRVGGASVSARHANIISADSDATASDIEALADLMQMAAFYTSGIELEPEVNIL